MGRAPRPVRVNAGGVTAREVSRGSALTTTNATEEDRPPNAVSAWAISSANTGQTSVQSALMKVTTATFPRTRARLHGAPAWSVRSMAGASDPARRLRPMTAVGEAPTCGPVGAVGMGGGPVPARVVSGVVITDATPALPTKCSAASPPSPSTANPTMTHNTNFLGTGTVPARRAPARSTGARPAKAAARSASDSPASPVAGSEGAASDGGTADETGAVGMVSSLGRSMEACGRRAGRPPAGRLLAPPRAVGLGRRPRAGPGTGSGGLSRWGKTGR